MSTQHIFLLLVDDDEDDRVLFEEVLEDLGQKVQLKTAEHGLDAVKQLENLTSHRPDAIFLDLNMPVMDGHECLKYIRSKSSYDDIKIIIYSTSYNPETVKTLEVEGANHFIRKPSNYLTLVEVIKNALSIIKRGDGHQKFLIAT
ncbi:response regulator [Subsaxibacter sp. CAU 1640]|uniref:response regulator n=1 Tax=Subsaxibacter sp. CAU 1640 TaxID=2933271 RepID=UPI002005FE4C|nr:response regulator [Subsaxibacter sp. CAU 1640]MCK7590628.1 response regulator [Subsaxibacter sp. CAU 1640]